MKYLIILFILGTILISGGCKKLVQVDSPISRFDAEKVYNKDATAIAVLTGIYQEMSGEGIFQGTGSFSFLLGLSADELIDYSGGNTGLTSAYQNAFTDQDVPFWQRLYRLVYTTNTAIEGINASNTLSPDVKKELLGEAKFMRAFFYFYLTNLWGDLPLVLAKDYKVNSSIKRSAQSEVYQQIISDLQESELLLGSDYLLSDLKTTSDERIRPNIWAAKALLSKVYLYTKKYAKAEAKATEIIERNDLFSLPALNDVFLSTSKEAIWQIQSIDPAVNTFDGKGFILTEAPNNFQPVSLSDFTLAAFKSGDQRRADWVGEIDVNGDIYRYANKYKTKADFSEKKECLMVFRLAEQYLIRAESRLEAGNLEGSVSDLNIIRTRARSSATIGIPNPLPNLSATLTNVQIMDAILNERQAELFTEWGNRWLDLKRTGKIDGVMSTVSTQKGGTWASYRALFPVPQAEFQYNRNMTQNSGY